MWTGSGHWLGVGTLNVMHSRVFVPGVKDCFAFGRGWGWWADGGLGQWGSLCVFVVVVSLFGLFVWSGGHWGILPGLGLQTFWD